MQNNSSSSWLVYALIAFMAYTLYVKHQPTTPDTGTDTEQVQVDDLGVTAKLQTALVSDHAREDARYFAAVFTATADRLEIDGQQNEPVISQRIQLETLLENLGTLATSGKTKGRYPELPGVLGELFQQELPKQQGPLTSDDRGRAVKCFRALATGCDKVAGGVQK